MDLSTQKLTYLVLAHGDIQASPQEIAKLNQQPMMGFASQLDKQSGTAAGYQVILTGYARHVLQKEQSVYDRDYRNLDDLLRQLRAMPRPVDGFALKGSVDTYRVENQYYRVDYRVASGQVQVFNIQPVTKLQRLRNARSKRLCIK